jgi:hypothetical protein
LEERVAGNERAGLNFQLSSRGLGEIGISAFEIEIFGAALSVVDDDDGNKGYQAGMSEFKVLETVETPHEPDVLLFSPIDSSVLVVGTYHLLTDGQRIGSLLLYSVNVETASWYVIDVS